MTGTGDVARPGLPAHGIVGPLPRFVALDFIREADHGQQNLVSRGVEGPLAILQVVGDTNSRGDQLLEEVGRLNLLAPEPALLAHHEHLERGRGFRVFIRRVRPGRFANSAPEIPSSW